MILHARADHTGNPDRYWRSPADDWIDPANGRHRLQLVHQASGGPYQYELADAHDSIWYAISQVYRPSIYLLNPDEFANLVHLRVSPEQRQRMLQARLQSGAWDIAADYLRQAASADLHAWGRRRDADGRVIDLVSFTGISPLSLPPDAPSAAASRVTVLLAIDEGSGRLREVRELLGEAGGEQTSRTTWRVVNEEWLDGYALRITSRLGAGADSQDVDLYQGEAARFGAYLRSVAQWHGSAPVTLHIGGTVVNGWQVVTTMPSPEPWTLFELDGTLLAVRAPPTQLEAVLARLQQSSADKNNVFAVFLAYADALPAL